jgi:hypothetical protein
MVPTRTAPPNQSKQGNARRFRSKEKGHLSDETLVALKVWEIAP